MADFLDEASVIVTVIMVDSVQERAVEEAQKPAFLRKISSVANLLSLSSSNVTRMQGQERDPSPIRNNMLSSDLLIHPPCNGKFIAELELKNIIGREQKDLVVKVSGTRLDILFAERSQEEKEPEHHVERVKKQKRGRLFKKNIFSLSRKMKKTRSSDVPKNRKLERKIEDRNLKAHGQILLPDFINPETLAFSINILGNLNIQAEVKGAIRVESGGPAISIGMQEGSTTRQGVFKKWLSVKCKGKKRNEKNRNNEKRNYHKSCSWELKNSDIEVIA